MKLKASILCLLVGAGSASAATFTVNQFEGNPGWEAEVVNTWYYANSWQTSSGGTQTIENGAARLTTGDAAAIANVSTWANFGSASVVLNSINLSYDFYKVGGSINPAAAPALKLTIFGSGYSSVGTLIYEPYYNGSVPTNAFTTVTIDQNTGGGNDATGGWWWTGGGFGNDFGIPGSAGGPPLRSLAEWATAFSPHSDFAYADVRGLSVGIGNGSPGEDTYFDNVSIRVGTSNNYTTYDFQEVPEPGTLSLFVGGLLLVGAYRRNRSQRC